MWGEGMRSYDRNIGTEIWARACSADRIFLSSILLSKLRALFVAWVVFCSVRRIGASGGIDETCDALRQPAVLSPVFFASLALFCG